ncbi:hypothetical protein D3C85_677760 [compost metagenome]
MQAQQALAAEQHIAVKEGIGQFVVGVMRGAGALVDVLGEEVQLEVAADRAPRSVVADAVQDDFLGGIQRRHHPAVLPGQGQPPLFHVELA